mmetsp:Transcript_43057/g.116158  ORF Transcript_43057/g.116158 Transcript_43057/m.116158 type:complete len:478 (-) Transcript_43057:169-1602(-)
MSGISHVLLVGFTIQFIIEGYGDATEADDDNGEGVNGYIVLGFALGGLTFDMITLLTYNSFGAPHDGDDDGVSALGGEGAEDALTCGINTNMCAALLHVVSDLARSTTTLVESIIIINMPNVNSTQADGVSTLIVCSIIVIGATGALLTWLREVYIFAVTPTGANDLETHDVVRNSLMRESSGMIQDDMMRDSMIKEEERNLARHSVSSRPSSIAEKVGGLANKTWHCCGCAISGNAISLLVAAILFAAITVTQWIFAEIANSDALKADCVSMGVDVLAFLGNLFAECNPFPDSKRRVELTMSGISHVLLVGFTIQFIIEGYGDATEADDDNGEGVNGYIVLGFALGGLTFDMITLLTYNSFGAPHDGDDDGVSALGGEGAEDALTCGINTNMCAALLHVVSDLARSTTTLVESIILLNVPSIAPTVADGVSTLVVCSIIVIGATGALLTWLREVYIFMVSKPDSANQGDYRQLAHA